MTTFQETTTMFDIKKMLSEQQTNASNEIFECFSTCCSCLLYAQFQSGKTSTYFRVAFDMLHHKRVKHVIILSGNSERSLRRQVHQSKKDEIRKYRNFLQNGLSNRLSNDEINNCIDMCEDKINILWGTELKKYSKSEIQNTLIIWDESHFAQDDENIPAKFFKKYNISVSGDEHLLKSKNNFFLSVSATPYSELSDVHHLNQQKGVVRLLTSNKYRGVPYMLSNNLIIGYDVTKYKETIYLIMEKHDVSQKYIVVRAGSSINDEQLRNEFISNGVLCETYNSHKTSTITDDNFNSLLETKPTATTIILLKEKCRMGAVVPKEYVGAFMETSFNPKTDTLGQSYIGRNSGYHNHDIPIYISDKFFDENGFSEELTRMTDSFANKRTVVPNRANNIKIHKKTNSSKLHEICPIKIGYEFLDLSVSEKNKDSIKETIRTIFNNDEHYLINHNSVEQTEEIKEQINSFNDKNINVMVVDEQKTYQDLPFHINKVFKSCLPGKLGTAKGIPSEGGKINVWWIKKDFPEYDIHSGDLFIDARVTIGTNNEMQQTTKKEVFCHSNLQQMEPIILPQNNKKAISFVNAVPIIDQNTNIDIVETHYESVDDIVVAENVLQIVEEEYKVKDDEVKVKDDYDDFCMILLILSILCLYTYSLILIYNCNNFM